MPGSDARTGDVYYYPYVWKRQGAWAEPEKDRPCCVAIRLQSPLRGSDVFMLALSQSGIPDGGFGEVVPEEYVAALKRLDRSSPTHVILSEYNADLSEHPNFHDLEYLGSLPIEYIKRLGQTFKDLLRTGVGEVSRAEFTSSSTGNPSRRF